MNFGKRGMQKKKRENLFYNRSRQLALPFVYCPRFISSDFISAPSNAAARTWLGIHHTTYLKPAWPDQRLALWGDPGTGKTHLLQIWAEKERALFLPASALAQNSFTQWLEPLQSKAIKALVIDDADLVSNPNDLLHLLNVAKENLLTIVLSGRQAPARWDMQLPDLASRLRAIMAVKIDQPEETLLRILFLRLLAEHQLVVSSSVIEWLLLRLPRTASAIREAAERLDTINWVEGRTITRNLAVKVLKDLLCYDENEYEPRIKSENDMGLFKDF